MCASASGGGGCQSGQTAVSQISEKFPDAQLYSSLTYREFIERNLGVMDSTAITLCQDNKMPIQVFNMSVPGNVLKVVCGVAMGTSVEA